VTRTGASVADRQMIACVAATGHQVSAAQLERWRARGWITHNDRHGSGRGRGSTSAFDLRTTPWVSAVAASTGPGKRGRDILVTAYLDCLVNGHVDSVVVAGAEPVVRAAMIDVLDHVIGSPIVKHPDREATDDQIDQAYIDAERAVAAGPAIHRHFMEDFRASLAGRGVPSRRSAIADSRSAMVQLAVAMRLPDVVEDRVVVESYDDLGILPTAVGDVLKVDVAAHEAEGTRSDLAAAIVPNGLRMRSAIVSASWSELSEVAPLALRLLAMRGLLTLFSLTNAGDPTVVGMKAALGFPDAAFSSIRLGPPEFVTQLSFLLANPFALPWVTGTLEAVGDVLAADDSDEHLVQRHLNELRRLAGESFDG
jgi:hypothetical protein